METQELLKKVRKIEIKAKGLSTQMFSGEYHSTFKGRGMAFSEVREYSPGDDVRTIDWNVTARSNSPHIKIFDEERELTVILLVDMSASKDFGSYEQYKKEIVTELCAVLSFSAIQNNDKIGVIFFSDQVEKYIPPKKGKSHILRIIRELIEFEPSSKKTNIAVALEYFASVIKKKAIVFLLSDFISPEFEKPLKIASKKHDIVALQIYDKRESQLPDLGLIKLFDAESEQEIWVDSSSREVRDKYEMWWQKNITNLQLLLKRTNVDLIQISTDESYIIPLKSFFKRREKRK